MNRSIIAAVSENGVIGVDNTLPWYYPGDFKFFKEQTLGSTIIMGRYTWESLPKKPLPDRLNVVVAHHPVPGADLCIPSLFDYLLHLDDNKSIWFIGGKRIFEEGMAYCNEMVITRIPCVIKHPRVIYFPEIDLDRWELKSVEPHPHEAMLKVERYLLKL